MGTVTATDLYGGRERRAMGSVAPGGCAPSPGRERTRIRPECTPACRPNLAIIRIKWTSCPTLKSIGYAAPLSVLDDASPGGGGSSPLSSRWSPVVVRNIRVGVTRGGLLGCGGVNHKRGKRADWRQGRWHSSPSHILVIVKRHASRRVSRGRRGRGRFVRSRCLQGGGRRGLVGIVCDVRYHKGSARNVGRGFGLSRAPSLGLPSHKSRPSWWLG